MRQTVFLSLLWIVAVGVVPLPAQQRDDALEVTVEDMQATAAGVSITLKASRSDDQLHMMIGYAEGEAIARALSHRTPQRPMTHDLIKAILGRTGWHVQKVVIRGISGGAYLADLVLEKNGQTEVIDSRPSDAMAIAVRSDAKIFVKPEVFEMERNLERQDPPEQSNPSGEGNIHL
ncbi:MAG: bifunctional nuclease family protein [Acidobacteria bacterium]|nr:bifunctional nuclease family protein [Acidobacteriota bacterium]